LAVEATLDVLAVFGEEAWLLLEVPPFLVREDMLLESLDR
jgi:hypothetical protein